MAITSNLDLANQALALLGEMSIDSLGDTSSKPSLLADEFVEQAILETLAMHEWQEAAKRASIASSGAATYGSVNRFPFPTGALRIVEVNDTTAGTSSIDYFIEEREIRANASTIYVRYIDDIAITACGPLLQQACAVRLATKLALPLTGSQERLGAMESLFTKTLAEARARDVAENPLTALVLSRLGISPDTISSDLLRRFRTFAEDARKEVLRSGLFTEALAFTTLSSSAGTLAGWNYSFTLPGLAIVEVASDAYGSTLVEYEIIGGKLATDTSPAYVRYIDDTAYTSLYSSTKSVVDARYAAKIAAALSLPSASQFEELYLLRLREARKTAMEEADLSTQVLTLVGEDLLKSEISHHQIRWFRKFADEARKEVLRLTYQDESTALSAMDSLSQQAVTARHAHKIAANRNLPSTAQFEELFQRRLTEAKTHLLQTSALNGRVLAMIGADLVSRDLSPTTLVEIATFADEARKEVNSLTYVSEATALGSMSTLAQECVDILHARKIASFLSIPSTAQFEELFQRRLAEAKARALQTSALNGRVLAMIQADLVSRDLSTTTLAEIVAMGDATRQEILRSHRWNCATTRAELVQEAATISTYPYKYELPAGCLRVIEVNGESYEEAESLFEIESGYLYCHATTAWIRYIDDVALGSLDSLLAEACIARHAARIASFLSLPSATTLEALAQKRLAEARQANAHVRSADNNPRHRLAARSTLLRTRGYVRNPLRLEDF